MIADEPKEYREWLSDYWRSYQTLPTPLEIWKKATEIAEKRHAEELKNLRHSLADLQYQFTDVCNEADSLKAENERLTNRIKHESL